MNSNLISLVREYSSRIKNDRTPEDVLKHLKLEVIELDQEFNPQLSGVDGIPGECVDVILCALDLIFVNNPEWTDEQILEYANKKCQKWKRKYSL